MDGIERITEKINADVQAEIDTLMAQAKAEADQITADSKAKVDTLSQELAAQGKRAAAEREERMACVAQLDARKVILSAKQGLLNQAFDKALEKLCTMEDEAYTELLANLLVKASRTKKEQVAFSQKDRTRVGKAAVTRANEILAKRSAQNNGISDNKAASPMDKVVTSVSTSPQGSTMLTLSEENRNIKGGFILIDGKVETNCSFETLVRLEKNSMSGEVAKLLFD